METPQQYTVREEGNNIMNMLHVSKSEAYARHEQYLHECPPIYGPVLAVAL